MTVKGIEPGTLELASFSLSLLFKSKFAFEKYFKILTLRYFCNKTHNRTQHKIRHRWETLASYNTIVNKGTGRQQGKLDSGLVNSSTASVIGVPHYH